MKYIYHVFTPKIFKEDRVMRNNNFLNGYITLQHGDKIYRKDKVINVRLTRKENSITNWRYN